MEGLLGGTHFDMDKYKIQAYLNNVDAILTDKDKQYIYGFLVKIDWPKNYVRRVI